MTRAERQEELRDKLYGGLSREVLEHVARVVREQRARPVTSGMLDRELCTLAEQRADLTGELVGGLTDDMGDEGMRSQLSAWLVELDAKPLPKFKRDVHPAEQLIGWIKRATCRLWWRRQLRRACVLLREHEGQAAGEVCMQRQVYCTDDTVQRRAEADKSNKAMLSSAEIESEAGDIITVWDAMQASVSNPAVRRAELMTRLRGCEEWADERGMVGIFTTNTCPSRFHPRKASGSKNPKHTTETPRDGQQWLRETWALTRAALQRRGVGFFGIRVAEPHHDGCPHWHMLLWCKPVHVKTLKDVMARYWLREAGDEEGAQYARLKVKRLEKGGAAAYCAKYVAKNIDDFGSVQTQGHLDEIDGKTEKINGKAARVRAWASAHGIRQFQCLGQPPVTVWRELRRVDPAVAAAGTERVRVAFASVHRQGERKACWRAFMEAQGGAMLGRKYLLGLARQERERIGRYETVQELRPVGVEDREAGAMVPSVRKEWKARGQRPAPTIRRLVQTQPGPAGELVFDVLPARRDEPRIVLGGLPGKDGSSVYVSRYMDDAEDGTVHALRYVEVPNPAYIEHMAKVEQTRKARALPRRVSEAALPPGLPWTRFNNCTRAGGPGALMGAGIVGARDWNRGREQSRAQHARATDPPDPGATRRIPENEGCGAAARG